MSTGRKASQTQQQSQPSERSHDERSPLLQNGQVDAGEGGDARELLKFEDDDTENPRKWPRRKKMINIAIIAMMSGMSLSHSVALNGPSAKLGISP